MPVKSGKSKSCNKVKQICVEMTELTQSSLNLRDLALDEQTNSHVLLSQNVEEVVFEGGKLIVGSAWHGDCLAMAGRCVFFDEGLDVVIINVVCEGLVSIEQSRALSKQF